MKPTESTGFGSGLWRPLEFAVCVIGLITLAPLLLVAMLAISLTSKGPVFFRQRRVGLYGQTFVLYKLRTMIDGVDGPQVTVNGDPRITTVGRVLRQTKIDEIPGLWNVIRGDLTLVGPRPEVPAYVDLSLPQWQEVLRAKPGITDPMTLRLRNEAALLAKANGDADTFYRTKLQPLKLAGYLEYLKGRTFRSDLVVILQTVLALFFTPRAETDSSEASTSSINELGRIALPVAPSGVSRSWAARILTRQTQVCLDLATLSCAFMFAYLLRFDFALGGDEVRRALYQLPYVVAFQFLLLLASGVYAFIWRYIGIAEIKAFVLAALGSALPVIVLRVALSDRWQVWRVPLSIVIVDTVIAFGAVLGIRVARRLIFERYERSARSKASARKPKAKVLLIGAGRAGMLAADQILSRGNLDLEIVGFVDDDVNKQRAVIRGVKVLGTTQDLPKLVRELDIDHVIISIAQASRNNFRRMLDICEEIPVKVRIIPGLEAILHGDVRISRIRDVEIEDLLGREPVRLDEENLLKFVAGKRVMVTGAGGSIGSELLRQLTRFRPASLLLVERAEFALFNIEHELRDALPFMSIVPLVADVCDAGRMRAIFKTYHPEIIFHAAAHKHVPMMESNPTEAVKNNVLGTREVAELAGQSGVEVFVLISTDKAVRPKSIMGATKRVAELVVQDLNRCYPTKYVAVRFGNVIGSAGSVIPIFRHQIEKGGPVTVTHKEMKRYFMTIPEAAQLVLQAGAMGNGGEIFILDMGEPVSILELAKETITLSGLKPFEDIDIVFTGLRAGEKLFEELDWANERITKTRHPKIFIGEIAAYPTAEVADALERLAYLSGNHLEFETCQFLSEFLPESNLEQAARITALHEGQQMAQAVSA